MPLPITAPRTWPMCNGPVGLTLTNSTCTRCPAPMSKRPKRGPAAMIALTCWRSQSSDSAKLMNPGPAIETVPTMLSSGILATIASAIARGGILALDASVIATDVL